MTSPERPAENDSVGSGDVTSANSECLQIIRKRSEFLKAAKAPRLSTTGFILQARKRDLDEGRSGIFIGYTCSKKVGNAAARNRAKRRLREIARMVLAKYGLPGWDYVLIGRSNHTENRRFADMCSDLKTALVKLHQ